MDTTKVVVHQPLEGLCIHAQPVKKLLFELAVPARAGKGFCIRCLKGHSIATADAAKADFAAKVVAYPAIAELAAFDGVVHAHVDEVVDVVVGVKGAWANSCLCAKFADHVFAVLAGIPRQVVGQVNAAHADARQFAVAGVG